MIHFWFRQGIDCRGNNRCNWNQRTSVFSHQMGWYDWLWAGAKQDCKFTEIDLKIKCWLIAIGAGAGAAAGAGTPNLTLRGKREEWSDLYFLLIW